MCANYFDVERFYSKVIASLWTIKHLFYVNWNVHQLLKLFMNVSPYIMTLNLWTMVFTLTLEVFLYFHQCLCSFQGEEREVQPLWEILSQQYYIFTWDNGIVLLDILTIKLLGAIGFLLYGKLLHLCPQRMTLFFESTHHIGMNTL